MSTFRPIPTAEVPRQWFKIRHDVKRALDNSSNTCWVEDVRNLLLRGEWSLTLIEDGEKYRGCLILALKEYPRKRALSVPILSGRKIEQMRWEVQKWLEDTAQRLDCSMIEMTGRLGWSRELRKQGWKTEMVSMTYEVQHGCVNRVSAD